MSRLDHEPEPRKLDVFAALSEAYGGVWRNFGEMLQLIWLPGLIYLGLSLVLVAFNMEEQVLLRVIIMLASFLLWPVIAIAWHRFILLGDTAQRSFQINYGQRELRFLLVSIALTLLFLPGLILAGAAAALTGQDPSSISMNATLMSFIGLGFLLVSVYLMVRLTLLLPAISVDAPLNVPLVLERTRGNFLRLLALFLLTALPMFLISGLMGMLVQNGGLPVIVGLIVNTLVQVFFAVLGVAILSIAYRELIQKAETEERSSIH